MATTTKKTTSKTTRKAPVKKAATTTTKKAPAKKLAVKKAPAKSTASKTTVRTVKKAAASAKARSSKKTMAMPSFRPVRQQEKFLTFRITHQTVYWLILSCIVIGLAVWVLAISIRVQNIYDQIDATNNRAMNMQQLNDLQMKIKQANK